MFDHGTAIGINGRVVHVHIQLAAQSGLLRLGQPSPLILGQLGIADKHHAWFTVKTAVFLTGRAKQHGFHRIGVGQL